MNSIAAELTKDHDELRGLLQQLAEDAGAPLPGELQATWGVLERRLVRHMEAEERFLLPLLEASNAPEVARIRREHAQIRDLLTELGVAVELHTIRAVNVAPLLTLLDAHAMHESKALYRLAGDKASTAVEHGIAERLKTALHDLSSRVHGAGRATQSGRARS